MTAPVAPPVPDQLRRTAPLPVHLAWVAPAAFVVAVVGWNAGAYAIDGSPLADPSVSLGYTFGTGLTSVFGGLPVGLLLTVPGCVALARRGAPPAGVTFSVWVSALAALGVALLAVGALSNGVTAGDAAELVFGVLTLVCAAVLLVPAYVVHRARRVVA